MLIKKAYFKKVHGHINQDLSFSRDVNILIGMNGSGKTTFLNAIAWILSPESVQGGLKAAYLLSTLEFEEITITFKLRGVRKHQRVTARKTTDAVEIIARDVEGSLHIPVVAKDNPTIPITLGRSDEASEFIEAQLDAQRTNEVLQYLNDLPGLLYLPVDRRWPDIRQPRFGRVARNRRIVSVSSLPIEEALSDADRVFRLERHRMERLNSELRHRLLASLFESPDPFPLSRITVSSMQELESQRARIVSTLDDLDLPDATREANLDSLVKSLCRSN